MVCCLPGALDQLFAGEQLTGRAYQVLTLEFHSAVASWEHPKLPAPMTTRRMFNSYPENIRAWLQNKGGIEKMTIEEYWTLTPPELWAMGYRKCEPGPMPALRNYRSEWK